MVAKDKSALIQAENNLSNAERTPRSYVKAAQFTQKLSNQKLREITADIAHCTIRAPAAGQVVYANERQRGEAVLIEEGSQIR